MTFIASMVSAAAISAGASALVGGIAGAAATGAVGAGLGAGVSAATGGDVGQGALMGGISGLASGALAAAAPALQGAEVATEVGKEVGKEAVVQGTEQAAVQGTGQVANQGISALPAVDPTAAVTPASQTVVNPATSQVAVNPATSQVASNPVVTSTGNGAPVVSGPVQPSKGVIDPALFEAKNVAANEANASWGSQLLSKAGIADAGQTGNAIGGKALENAVYGAGINGLLAGAQGKDVGRGMLTGAVSGGVGGAAAGGLGQMGGTVGQFAANNPGITSALVGGATNMALDNALTSDPTMPEERGIRANVKWDPSVYRPYGPQFAAGGITDLDNYDQSPQMQNPGTLDIPNRNEVSNNQGYMGDSVQMMAKGGLSYGGGGLLGSPMLDMGIVSALPQGTLSFLPESGIARDAYDMTAGRFLSPDLADHLYKSQDDVDKDEKDAKTKEGKVKAALIKQKVMQQLAQQGQAQGMAHGGISDLGGYSDGGRLLKGPGTGVSDDIPATIEGRQPARLAANEFVVPARIVSEIGNGSTDAGAKALYAMMDRVQKDRKKSMGKGKFAVDSKASRHLDDL